MTSGSLSGDMHLSVEGRLKREREGKGREEGGREEGGREGGERLYSPYSVSTYRGLLSVDTGV